MILNMSGGGAALNLKVVGGTAQPLNPRENTIWVNTDTAITEWAFANENPYSEPIEGAVWIKTSYASTAPINILKKNNVTVLPSYAYQYINGELISKEFFVYQNGHWVDLEVLLYNEGFDNTPITGGWAKRRSGGAATDCTELYLTAGGDSSMPETQHSTTAFTKNKIDFSSFFTLSCDLNISYAYTYIYISTTQDSSGKVAEIYSGTNGNQTLTIDVSTLHESYYIVFQCNAPYMTNCSYTVSKVVLR